MASEFFPGLEAETNDKGEIGFDAGKIHDFHLKDVTFKDSDVQRTPIGDFENEGFLLYNVFTSEECAHVINFGEEIGFDKIYGVKDEYRSCPVKDPTMFAVELKPDQIDRHQTLSHMCGLTLKSEELAEKLWERVKSHIEDLTFQDDHHKQHIHGIDFQLKGKWKPYGLNNIFRLCRYFPGGHFAPHFDGFYTKNSKERSMKTFMLYLNGDFTGGSTNFVDEEKQLYMDNNGKYCAEEKNIRERVQPTAGMAIIFNHHRLHEGSQLKDGKKYILRTDIMYRKCGENNYSAEEERALQLLQEAERLEGTGECMKAAELYRKAFKLAPSLENAF